MNANDEELYSEDRESDGMDNPEPEKDQTETKSGDTEYPSELVSKKSISLKEGQDLKPGDTLTFKVVKDYGDEVEIRCEHKKTKSEDEELSELASDNY